MFNFKIWIKIFTKKLSIFYVLILCYLLYFQIRIKFLLKNIYILFGNTFVTHIFTPL